jgi:hypothetical protein
MPMKVDPIPEELPKPSAKVSVQTSANCEKKRKYRKFYPRRVASSPCSHALAATTASEGVSLKLFPPIHEVPATITKIVVILVDRQFSSKQWLSSDPFQPPTLRFCLRALRTAASFVAETYELQECCALASWRSYRWDLRQ